MVEVQKIIFRSLKEPSLNRTNFVGLRSFTVQTERHHLVTFIMEYLFIKSKKFVLLFNIFLIFFSENL